MPDQSLAKIIPIKIYMGNGHFGNCLIFTRPHTLIYYRHPQLYIKSNLYIYLTPELYTQISEMSRKKSTDFYQRIKRIYRIANVKTKKYPVNPLTFHPLFYNIFYLFHLSLYIFLYLFPLDGCLFFKFFILYILNVYIDI